MNGGKILAYHKKDHDPKWWTDQECVDFSGVDNFSYIIEKSLSPDYVLIVIDDEYVDFRKAMAEGKIVQYNFGNYGINRKDFPNTWKDLDISVGILADRAHPDNYRIKPDEPKFKVGDWIIITAFDNKQLIVKYENHILKENVLIMNNTIYFPPGRGLEYTRLWQPQPGEWVIPDSGVTDNTFIVMEYSEVSSISKRCQPFIGELPSHLKDK